jgi:hypothetical protein
MKLLRLALSSIVLSFPSFAFGGNVSHGPTYAPGGHAIIPTAPTPAPASVAPRPAPSSINIVPSYSIGSTPPITNYAPGGHAIIPTVPQGPTFSPSFTSSPQITSPPITIPSHQNIQPPTIQSSSRATVASHPSFSGPGASTLPSPSQSFPNQIMAPSVGQIPPQTLGRLQLTPMAVPVGTSMGNSGIANSTPQRIQSTPLPPIVGEVAHDAERAAIVDTSAAAAKQIIKNGAPEAVEGVATAGAEVVPWVGAAVDLLAPTTVHAPTKGDPVLTPAR